RVPDARKMAQLEAQAAAAAAKIQAALAGAERASLEGAARLAVLLTSAPDGGNGDAGALRRQVSIALAELLLAIDHEAALVYEFGSDVTNLELVTAHAPAAALPRVAISEGERPEDELARAVGEA